ncbi:hypothetical protein BB560_003823 [Smittium megazygosporum]|uniref:Pacifastin domain-containing protein n=1 Tax=Smittium megazygosporum TaxID=133381 RepID=A0A2T9ZAX3_9FUNG|nr:hypothetical protein BB560_003823 [Smittium megazygosporum]
MKFPNSLFLCLVLALVSISVSAASISERDNFKRQDDSSPDSPEPDTKEYKDCVAKHGGKRTWPHPDHPCNSCWCSPAGSVACTKMFCYHMPLDQLPKAD